VVTAVCLLAIATMALLCEFHGGGIFIWLNFYQLVADVKLAVTLVKYIPQVSTGGAGGLPAQKP
jgi:hypothetical protein